MTRTALYRATPQTKTPPRTPWRFGCAALLSLAITACSAPHLPQQATPAAQAAPYPALVPIDQALLAAEGALSSDDAAALAARAAALRARARALRAENGG